MSRSRRTASQTFWCRYGQHYSLPMRFERKRDNKGICSECAVEVYNLLREDIFLPELGTKPDGASAELAWEAEREQAAAVDRLRKGSTDPGWVYYVEQGGLIKIGYSADVNRRIRAYGPTATLLAVHPGTLQVEQDMHHRFAKDRARGREWFTPSDALREHIADVLERFGDPSVFAYEFTVPKSEEQKVRDSLRTRPYSVIAN